MIIALCIAGWVLCGVLGYLRFRSYFRHEFGDWNQQDRLFGVCLIFTTGPIGLLSAIVNCGFANEDWLNRPAKW